MRARIVAAADALYYARGIHEVGMDAVRTASGLSLKRIYSIFPSKVELVVAVLDERRRVWDRGLAQALGRAARASRDSCSRSSTSCGTGSSRRTSGAASSSTRSVSPARRPSPWGRWSAQQKSDFQRLVERLALEAGGTATLGRQLALLAEGAQTSAAIGNDPSWADDARAAAESLIDLALGHRAA